MVRVNGGHDAMVRVNGELDGGHGVMVRVKQSWAWSDGESEW